MTQAWFNFERYLILTSLVIATALLMMRLLRVPDAQVRLRYLYLTLVASLAVPFSFVQHRRFGVPQFVAPPITIPIHLDEPWAGMGPQKSPLEMWWNGLDWGWKALFAVALLRVCWLCVGLLRLHLYRRRAILLAPLPDHLRALRTQQRVDAPIYLSKEVSGPVTFGLVSPTVLLPEAFLELDAAQQSAILCHEFVHVRRNDPVKVFGEEVLRSVLWFHPCVWWLLGRIQLCREQVVDDATIAITEDRDTYLETLLEFARRNVMPDLAPATNFFKRSHLLERVKAISQEVNMPAALRRLHVIGLHAMLLGALSLGIWWRPLMATPQFAPDTAGVSISTPYTVLHRTPVELRSRATSGQVVVHVTLNNSGEVKNARVLSGPEELRGSVVQSVSEWHFASDTPKEFDLTVSYDATRTVVSQGPMRIGSIDASALPVEIRDEFLRSLPYHVGDVVEAKTAIELYHKMSGNDARVEAVIQTSGSEHNLTYRMRGPGSPPMPPPPPSASTRLQLTRIAAEALPEELRARAVSALRLKVGDSVNQAEIGQRLAALTSVDLRLRHLYRMKGDATVEIYLYLQGASDSELASLPPEILWDVKPLRVTRIDAEGLPEDRLRRAMDVLGVMVGDKISQAELRRRYGRLRQMDGQLTPSWSMNGDGNVELHLVTPGLPHSAARPEDAVRVTVGKIDTSALPADLRAKVEAQSPLHSGDTMSAAEFKEKSQALRNVEHRLNMSFAGQSDRIDISLRAYPDPPVAGVGTNIRSTIERIDASSLPEPLRRQVLDQFGLREGESVTQEQLRERLKAITDRHVSADFLYTYPDDPKLQVRFHLVPATAANVEGLPALRPIHTVAPVYPPLAKQARVQGTVRFTLVVAADGTVTNIQLVNGHPLLVPAAVDAVRQYRFAPIPDGMKGLVDVNFFLNPMPPAEAR